MNSQDRRWIILEGLFFSLLFIALSLAMLFIPWGLGLLFIVLLPALPALHVVRRGFMGALGFALVTIGVSGLVGDVSMMLAAIFLYSIGLGLGRGLHKQVLLSRASTEAQITAVLNPMRLPPFLIHSSVEAFLQGFCGGMIGVLLLLAATPLLTEMTLVDYFDATLVESIRIVQELPASLVTEVGQTAEMVRSLQDAREMLQSSFALILFCATLLITFPAFMLARFIIPRFAGPLPPLPPFRRWGLPRASAYVLCATLLPVLFFENTSRSWLFEMVASVNQLLFLLCVFQGMAVIDFFLHRWRFPKWLCYLLRPLLFLVPLMQQMLLLVGLVDVGVDMRKLRPPSGREGQNGQG